MTTLTSFYAQCSALSNPDQRRWCLGAAYRLQEYIDFGYSVSAARALVLAAPQYASGLAAAGLTTAYNNVTTTAAAYDATILAESSLVSRWGLGETSGTVANDSKGTANGTYIGTPLLNQAALVAGGDGSVKFNGTSQYVQIAAAGFLLATPTLEAWVSIPLAPTADRRVMAMSDNTSWLGINSAQHAFCGIFNGLNRVVTGTATIALNTPTHLAMQYDGTAVRLFVNGAADGSLSAAAISYGAITSNAAIAGETAGSTGFDLNGTVDEAAIYSTAISSLSAHYTAGLG